MTDLPTLTITPDDDGVDALGNPKKAGTANVATGPIAAPTAAPLSAPSPATAAMPNLRAPVSYADKENANDAPTGFQQLVASQEAKPYSDAPQVAQPITATTPTSVLQRKVGNMAYNFTPGQGPGDGNMYADSPGGQMTIHDDDGTFLRPVAGPQSLSAVLQRQSAGPITAAAAATPAATNPNAFAGVTGSSFTMPATRMQPTMDAAGNPIAPAQLPSAASPSPAAAPGIDSGVTVNGRRLNYGAMVNGVPTFSDGTSGQPGVAGNIPRTMTNADIQNLGANLQTVSAPKTALASDGLGYTPSSDQMVATLQRNMAQPITGSRPSAADFAQADNLAVASQDPRSALGIAARNLSVDAQYGESPALRRSAAASLANLQQSVAQQGSIAQDGAIKSGQIAQEGQNTLADENLRGQYGLAQGRQNAQLASLTRERHPVTLADGTIATMDPVTGQITPSIMANGQPGKALMPKDDAAVKRTDEITDSIGKGAQDLQKNFIPTPAKPAPTDADVSGWRLQTAKTMGLPVGYSAKSGKWYANVNGQTVPL